MGASRTTTVAALVAALLGGHVAALPAAALPAAALAATAPATARPAPAGRPVVLVAGARDGVVQLDPATGRRLRLLVRGAADPALSADGTRLAFTLPEGRSRHVWVSDLQGRERRRLTSGPAVFSAPDWSPAGSHLALCRNAYPSPQRLALVRADGTRGHLLRGGEGGCEPNWSPDGALLAFTALRHVDGQPRWATDVVGVDGRNRERLLDRHTSPDWAPDGRLAAVRQDGDANAVEVVALPSRRTTTLTPFQGYHVTWGRVRWAPDGRSVYTDAGTEDFPPPSGTGATGSIVQRLRADGEHDPLFEVTGLASPSVAGGPPPPSDLRPPGRATVTATAGPARIALRTSLAPDPDRAGVLVRYVPGPQAPRDPAAGLPGGRSLSGSLVLTRLAPSTTYSVSVWPVDWSGNLGPRSVLAATTTREVPTSVELSASGRAVPGVEARLLPLGSTVTLAGRVTRRATGAPVPRARVDLLGHRQGEPDRLLARLTTDADGRFAHRRQVLADTRYTARFPGSGTMTASWASVLVRPTTLVHARLSGATVRRGTPATVLVSVRPVRPGERVVVDQESLDLSFQAQVEGRQDRRGRARLPLRTSRPGTFVVSVRSGSPVLVDGVVALQLVVR